MFSIQVQTRAFAKILARAAQVRPPAPKSEYVDKAAAARKIYEPIHCFRLDVDERGSASLTSVDGNVVAIFDITDILVPSIAPPEPGSILVPRARIREIVDRVKADSITIEDVPRPKKKNKSESNDSFQVRIDANGDHFTFGTFDPALFFRERIGIEGRGDDPETTIRGVDFPSSYVASLARSVIPFTSSDSVRWGLSSALAEWDEADESVRFTATDLHAMIRVRVPYNGTQGRPFPGDATSAMIPAPVLRVGSLLALADAMEDPALSVRFGTARSSLNNDRVGFEGKGWAVFGPPGLGKLPTWESAMEKHRPAAMEPARFANPLALLGPVRLAAILTSDAARSVELQIRPDHAIPWTWTALASDGGFGAVAMADRVDCGDHDPITIGYRAATLIRLLRAFPMDCTLTMTPGGPDAPTHFVGGDVEAMISPTINLARNAYPAIPEFPELEAALS